MQKSIPEPSVALFDAFTPAQRERLVDAMTRRRVVRGERLYGEGDTSDALYVICHGRILLEWSGERPAAIAGAGEMVGETAFLRCTVWGGYAENVCKSLTKVMRVIVQGALGQRGYETKEGEKRTTFEVEVYEIGPVLRYARAEVHRVVQDADSVAPGSGRRAAAKTPQPAGADAPF